MLLGVSGQEYQEGIRRNRISKTNLFRRLQPDCTLVPFD